MSECKHECDMSVTEVCDACDHECVYDQCEMCETMSETTSETVGTPA